MVAVSSGGTSPISTARLLREAAVAAAAASGADRALCRATPRQCEKQFATMGGVVASGKGTNQ